MHSSSELIELYDNTFNKNNFNTSPSGLYEPVNHIMNMKGKRIRPLLLMMSCEMFGGKVAGALNPAFAIEVFHNFTLVHDDIMDNADIRRGITTVHKMYGINAGILAGDAMLAYAYKYLANVPHQFVPALLDVFNKTAIEIFEGQQLDMDFEQRMDVTADEYLKMIEFKTSVLLGCSLQLGAILAGANAEDQKSIYEFGLNLGLSFQIKDDYLDAFGEEDKVGKRIGGDILNNKKTLLFITALNEGSTADKKQMADLLHEQDEIKKIAEVKRIFEASGAKQKTLDKAEALYNAAVVSLNNVSLPADKKATLAKMAEMINNREY